MKFSEIHTWKWHIYRKKCTNLNKFIIYNVYLNLLRRLKNVDTQLISKIGLNQLSLL